MAERSRLKARACRNLTLEFGEDNDHKDATERLRDEQRRTADFENELNEMLATNLNSKIQRWNFDFVTETPLEGDWEWYPEEDSTRSRREETKSEEGVTEKDNIP